MGASVIPATSGGAPITSWVQLATSSPTSGATVSFTSLASYKQYRVVMSTISVGTGNPTLSMTLNNNATSYSYAIAVGVSGTYKNQGYQALSSISINPGSTSLTPQYSFTAEILIDYANQATPKSIKYALAPANGFPEQAYFDGWAIWNNTATVDRIDFTLSSSSFVAASTFTVFGSN